MKCPKCGNESNQFVSDRSGGGFSGGKGCCGYMVLGPIGILCGACGNKEEKDEYWVCSACGHHFYQFESENYARIEEKNEKKRKELENTCQQYRKEIGEADVTEKEIDEELERIHKTEEELSKREEECFARICNGENKKARKLAKKLQGQLHRGCALMLLFAASIVLLFVFLPVGLCLLLASIVILCTEASSHDKAKKQLCEADEEFKEIVSLKNQLDSEKKACKEYKKKFDFINNYEK